MASLTKHPFGDDDWESVQAFDCGDAPYELEVSRWLKGAADEDSALASIHNDKRPGKVWLYKLDDGTLVGFGALGKSEWRWTGKKDPRVPLTVIIWVGLQKEFQGQPPPPTPKEERYSARILDDLIAEAVADAETHPILGLFVHKDNVKAIRLYQAAGFTADGLDPVRDTAGEVAYYKMAMVLNDEALLRLLPPRAKKKSE